MFLLFVTAAVTLAGAGCDAPTSRQSSGNPPAPTLSLADTPAPLPTPATQTYKDGTYTATGEYKSPGGMEALGVTVTMSDGVVVEVSVEAKATVPISKNMQKLFVDNFKPLVIGKKISDLQLSKVSGSSLTPKGFNDALTKIKAQSAS